MFSSKKKEEQVAVKVLTHDAVMGDLTGTHERLVQLDIQNLKEKETIELERMVFLVKSDAALSDINEERIQIDRSMKFFSAFAAGKDIESEVVSETNS